MPLAVGLMYFHCISGCCQSIGHLILTRRIVAERCHEDACCYSNCQVAAVLKGYGALHNLHAILDRTSEHA
jgi:hypothetical protein